MEGGVIGASGCVTRTSNPGQLNSLGLPQLGITLNGVQTVVVIDWIISFWPVTNATHPAITPTGNLPYRDKAP